MKFSELCVSTFNITFCILALLGVLSLSINIFRFLNAISISKDLEDAVISSGAIIFYLLYMFIANYFGQIITDYNYEIFERVYDTPWYLISIPSRKLILFLMQKTGKEFNLRIGFIIVGKVESFAMLLNSALSYVAVMFSIH
ncbi:uncharacterized protein LOC109610510 [Camponotus floridanus]|uniref:uncharacterized protein LOC109610510 n=1 Tax=Camponotus floridanus TaxID=104421 RepID=UPI000971611C|nr:uncharacterized protein LOC109610510 [Camponotus floridanus]